MRPLDKNSPYSTPVPIRLTDKQMAEIESVAKEFGMSKAESIRLACSAGPAALQSLTPVGLPAAVARVPTEEGFISLLSQIQVRIRAVDHYGGRSREHCRRRTCYGHRGRNRGQC